MIFKYRETGPLLVNCYIVGDEKTREAVVIDPGGDAEAILYLLKEDDLTVKAIINTHTHFDHIGGNAELHRATDAPILLHPAEKDALNGMNAIAQQWGMAFEQSPPAGGTLEEGDVVEMGELKLDVIHTPGHSPGGISFKVRDMPMAIVGDCLFQFSIGRTDFPGASHALLIKSIKEKLIPLGDDCEVYPGHGPPTLIGREKKFNPFLQEDGAFGGGGAGLIVPP
jgi:glyoxylase-like metal-dependent hydrolase (beta-lactamase superfamily II)